MTYSSEERWDPVDNGGVPVHSGAVETVFLHEDDLAALDAELAARAARPPMGFIPAQ